MDYSKKLHLVVIGYLKKTGQPAFKPRGGPTPQYWAIRRILMKEEPDVVEILYQTLQDGDLSEAKSIGHAIELAKKKQTENRWEEAREEIAKTSDITKEAYSLDAFLNI